MRKFEKMKRTSNNDSSWLPSGYQMGDGAGGTAAKNRMKNMKKHKRRMRILVPKVEGDFVYVEGDLVYGDKIKAKTVNSRNKNCQIGKSGQLPQDMDALFNRDFSSLEKRATDPREAHLTA